ncbi:MAG: hypothetical protein ACRC7N_12710 [Clostridium sp.]
MKKYRISVIIIILIIIVTVVTCFIGKGRKLGSQIKGSNYIINTVDKYSKNIGMSIDMGEYLIEDWEGGFNIDEEIQIAKAYKFEVDNRELVNELEVKLIEYKSLIEINIFDTERLLEIKTQIKELKEIAIKWRADNKDKSMFID